MHTQREPSPPFAESVIVSSKQNQSQTTRNINEQFLQEPTLAFLESYQSHLHPSLASGIFVLSLSKLHLNSIGDIGQFTHIQICDLSSNFIETIDALIVNCQQLIKLDLHSNRVRNENEFNVFIGKFLFCFRLIGYQMENIGKKCCN